MDVVRTELGLFAFLYFKCGLHAERVYLVHCFRGAERLHIVCVGKEVCETPLHNWPLPSKQTAMKNMQTRYCVFCVLWLYVCLFSRNYCFDLV